MDKPLFFSIIIPTYNRAHMILQTLETTFNQNYEHYEVILIDDDVITEESDDDTKK